MPRQEVTDAIAQAAQIMKDGGKSEHGVQAFELIENSTVLTPQEKQECFQELVKAGVTESMKQVVDGSTLLRGNNATTGLMTAFMDKYASDYNAKFQDVALKEASKMKVPSSIKKVTSFGPISDYLTDANGNAIPQKDVDAFNQQSAKLAETMLKASEANLGLLSPEAKAFIKSAMEPTQGNDAAKNMVAANTLFLRGANAQFSEGASAVRSTSKMAAEGALMCNANIIMQTYVNTVNNPLTKVGPKPQDKYAAQLRTANNVDQTKEAFTALSTGGATLSQFEQKMGGYDSKVSKQELEKSQLLGAKFAKGGAQSNQRAIKTDVAKLEEEFGAQLDKLTRQQQDLNRMKNNPSLGDKFKAFFQGGMDKACQKQEGKINTTTNGIADTIQTFNSKPENKGKIEVDKILNKYESRLKEFAKASDKLIDAGGMDFVMAKAAKMDTSDMGAQKQMYKQYQKNEAKMTQVEDRKHAMETVRDTLAKNAPKQTNTQAQTQSKGVGL